MAYGAVSKANKTAAIWAKTHNMSIREAKRDPAYRAYYERTKSMNKSQRSRAWIDLGVVEYDSQEETYGLTPLGRQYFPDSD